MNRLRLLVVATLLLGTASVASAQDPQGRTMGGGRGAARGMGMLMQGITLTVEQQVKVDSINAHYGAQRQQMIRDTTIDDAARRGKIREIVTSQQNEIKAVLTAEQKAVYEKNAADMAARRRQPPTRD